MIGVNRIVVLLILYLRAANIFIAESTEHFLFVGWILGTGKSSPRMFSL